MAMMSDCAVYWRPLTQSYQCSAAGVTVIVEIGQWKCSNAAAMCNDQVTVDNTYIKLINLIQYVKINKNNYFSHTVLKGNK